VVSTPTPGVPRGYPGESASYPTPPSDDGWSTATPVRSGSATGYGEQPGYEQPGHSRPGADRPLPPELDPRRKSSRRGAPATAASPVPAAYPAPEAGRRRAALDRSASPERGLPSWAALRVLLVIAGIGGLIDTISGASVRGGFNIGIVVASVVAILIVRRSGMFPIVVAPPIVYSLASGIMLYARSGGLHDKGVLLDTASNWLVYGFPAIAGATAAVLIIAGVRLIIRK
jgi:hypothetical protein